jgi:hypothetical protein
MALHQPKNRGPLLVDKVRGYFDRLPDWLRTKLTIRVEKQKVDAEITDIDTTALESSLKQEVTDEKLRENRYLGDGAVGSGNDFGELPVSHPSKVVLPQTGQVADVSETVDDVQTPLVAGPPLQDGSSEQVGDLWVTKKVEAPTFDEAGYQTEIQDLLPPEFKAQVPTKTEKHTVDGTAAMPVLAAGELSKGEQQAKVGVKSTTVVSTRVATTPVLGGMRVEPQWNGARLLQTQKIVPKDTLVTQTFGMTEATVKAIDAFTSLQETWSVDGGTFPTVSFHEEFNPDIQVGERVTQSVVPVGSSYTLTANDMSLQEGYIDSVHKVRKVSTLSSFPPMMFSYSTQRITFPGILYYLSFSLVNQAAANTKKPQFAVGMRAPFTVPALVWTHTDFWTTEPAVPGLYTWAPTDIIFQGISYSVNLSNVLTDAWSNIGVTYTSDVLYGNTVDRFNISATNPSATTYINLIGSWVPIGCTIDRYKRLWVRKISYITLR